MNALFMMILFDAIICLVISMPWIFCWSLNILFGLHIAYTFETWVAAFVLVAILTGSGIKFKK